MNRPGYTTKHAQAGLTFIEVIAAMAVVAIGLTALIRLQLVSISATTAAESATRAILIAQEKMDEALTESFEKVYMTSGISRQAGRDYKWQTQITKTQPAHINKLDLAEMRKIDVKVSWMQGNHNKEISLCTYRAEETLSDSN